MLYPECEPFATGRLDVDGGHRVYFEQSGNVDGCPVIFLHGGPGSGCNENHRRYFNPSKYRIIIFDQRGCHRSTPNGSVEDNTTQRLLADMEAIRQTLDIAQWVLFGGSWGATLALLYAEQYPQHVAGLILRGTFLARQCDFDWFAHPRVAGVNQVFPDYWQEFISLFNVTEKDDLITALHRRVFSDDKAVALQAAKHWALWSGRVVTHNLALQADYVVDENDETLLNEVMIEIHYAQNRYFIDENAILNNIASVPNSPCTLLHGRRDLTCLPSASWAIHHALPGSKMIMVPGAGHLASEVVMVDALIAATDQMLNQIT